MTRLLSIVVLVGFVVSVAVVAVTLAAPRAISLKGHAGDCIARGDQLGVTARATFYLDDGTLCTLSVD